VPSPQTIAVSQKPAISLTFSRPFAETQVFTQKTRGKGCFQVDADDSAGPSYCSSTAVVRALRRGYPNSPARTEARQLGGLKIWVTMFVGLNRRDLLVAGEDEE